MQYFTIGTYQISLRGISQNQVTTWEVSPLAIPSQSVQSRVPACDPLNHHVTPESTSTTTHSTPQPSNADFKQLCMFDFIFLRPRLLFSRILVQYSSNRVILWKTCCPALLLFSSPCLSTLIEPSCPVTMEVETSCAQCSSTRMIF